MLLARIVPGRPIIPETAYTRVVRTSQVAAAEDWIHGGRSMFPSMVERTPAVNAVRVAHTCSVDGPVHITAVDHRTWRLPNTCWLYEEAGATVPYTADTHMHVCAFVTRGYAPYSRRVFMDNDKLPSTDVRDYETPVYAAIRACISAGLNPNGLTAGNVIGLWSCHRRIVAYVEVMSMDSATYCNGISPHNVTGANHMLSVWRGA